MARTRGKRAGMVKQVAGGHGPKQHSGHLFGAAGGVQGGEASKHKMKGSHRSHKQHTGTPGKHT